MSRVFVAGTKNIDVCCEYLEWCGHEVHRTKTFDADVMWVVGDAEAVVLTPGWEHSRAAVTIKMVAETSGIPVQYYHPDQMHGDRLQDVVVLNEKIGGLGKPGRAGEVRVVNLATGGEKGRKPARFELIPPRALEQVAVVYGVGADKYEDRNWERGVDWSLMFGAMMRHMWLWWAGETDDVESGLNHLAHAAFHVLGLMQLTETHPGLDDRPKLGA